MVLGTWHELYAEKTATRPSRDTRKLFNWGKLIQAKVEEAILPVMQFIGGSSHAFSFDNPGNYESVKLSYTVGKDIVTTTTSFATVQVPLLVPSGSNRVLFPEDNDMSVQNIVPTETKFKTAAVRIAAVQPTCREKSPADFKSCRLN